MGNRAVVIFKEEPSVGVHLHWNGGPESILAFLQDMSEQEKECRGPVAFIQTVANFMDFDGLSLYLGTPDSLDRDNGDNGTYHVAGYNVVGREFLHTAGWASTKVADLSPTQLQRYEDILTECRANRAALKRGRDARAD